MPDAQLDLRLMRSGNIMLGADMLAGFDELETRLRAIAAQGTLPRLVLVPDDPADYASISKIVYRIFRCGFDAAHFTFGGARAG